MPESLKAEILAEWDTRSEPDETERKIRQALADEVDCWKKLIKETGNPLEVAKVYWCAIDTLRDYDYDVEAGIAVNASEYKRRAQEIDRAIHKLENLFRRYRHWEIHRPIRRLEALREDVWSNSRPRDRDMPASMGAGDPKAYTLASSLKGYMLNSFNRSFNGVILRLVFAATGHEYHPSFISNLSPPE